MDFALYQLKSLVSGSVIGGISLGGELVESQSTSCGGGWGRRNRGFTVRQYGPVSI